MNLKSREEGRTRFTAAAFASCILMVTSLAACSTPTTPVWQTEDLDACQKAVAKEGFNLEKKIFGALKKCADKYRQELVDGDPIGPAATGCETALGKVLTFPDPTGKSAMAKTKMKLDALAADPAKCLDDGRLVALGHPPKAEFGDLWARLIMVQSLKQAVDSMLGLVGDTVDVFAQLQANGCPSCAQIASTPCTRTTCSLVAGSQLYLAPITAVVSMSADLSMEACTNISILGNDVALFSGARQRMQRINYMAGGIGQCVRVGGVRGFIAGAGSTRPAVAVETCSDHIFGDTDECPALLGGLPICSDPQTDVHHAGVTNSGVCMNLGTSPSVAGDSFLFAAVESQLVCSPGSCSPDTRGSDLLACTDDDVAPLARFSVPLSTESAEATILDADNTNSNSITYMPITGVPASIDATDKRFSGTWVTALPGLHAFENSPMVDLDQGAFLTLKCD